jgi:hypothetical protein
MQCMPRRSSHPGACLLTSHFLASNGHEKLVAAVEQSPERQMRPHGDTTDGSASLDPARSGRRPSFVRFEKLVPE